MSDLVTLERRDRIRAMNARREELRQDGYTGHLDKPGDRRQAQHSRCESCNRRGLNYFAVVRVTPPASVGFMHCPACGWHCEF